MILPPRRDHHLIAPGPAGQVVRGMDRSVAMVDHMLRIASDESVAPAVVTTCGTLQATYAGSIWISIVSHLMFGVVLGGAYAALVVRKRGAVAQIA